mmetsp:Transcript_92265/g.214348  ORF Transcript_92265/g.214348 Transcript_92265/m.214348 type:complete len:343 (+) Transcript_92265:52-1080(+)
MDSGGVAHCAPAGTHLMRGTLFAAGLALVSVALTGCGGGGGDGGKGTTTTTTTTTSTDKFPLYTCSSPVMVPKTQKMSQKGMCVDDTTFWHCSNQMPGRWPNTKQETVGSLRLFKAWHPSWGDDAARNKSWAFLKTWVETNNAKVLMGAEVTCDPKSDEQMWQWNLALMHVLGKDRVLGVSMGNEMDIWWRVSSQDCIDKLWNGRYWDTLQARVADMDKQGFQDTKITIVWSMSVLGGNPWKEDGQAKVNTLVNQAFMKWGSRWVWSFNVYAIWDTNLYPTSAKDCAAKTAAAVNISYTQAILSTARERIQKTTNATNDTVWVGENGWSSPMPVGHPLFPFC